MGLFWMSNAYRKDGGMILTTGCKNSIPIHNMSRRYFALPEPNAIKTYVRSNRKIGHNELCPCSSGKKFKKCHGK